MGPAWQFKGWPFDGNPVEIFSKSKFLCFWKVHWRFWRSLFSYMQSTLCNISDLCGICRIIIEIS
jgi:hypothetical protein